MLILTGMRSKSVHQKSEVVMAKTASSPKLEFEANLKSCIARTTGSDNHDPGNEHDCRLVTSCFSLVAAKCFM